jgi:hypothetical protein
VTVRQGRNSRKLKSTVVSYATRKEGKSRGVYKGRAVILADSAMGYLLNYRRRIELFIFVFLVLFGFAAVDDQWIGWVSVSWSRLRLGSIGVGMCSTASRR